MFVIIVTIHCLMRLLSRWAATWLAIWGNVCTSLTRVRLRWNFLHHHFSLASIIFALHLCANASTTTFYYTLYHVNYTDPFVKNRCIFWIQNVVEKTWFKFHLFRDSMICAKYSPHCTDLRLRRTAHGGCIWVMWCTTTSMPWCLS